MALLDARKGTIENKVPGIIPYMFIPYLFLSAKAFSISFLECKEACLSIDDVGGCRGTPYFRKTRPGAGSETGDFR